MYCSSWPAAGCRCHVLRDESDADCVHCTHTHARMPRIVWGCNATLSSTLSTHAAWKVYLHWILNRRIGQTPNWNSETWLTSVRLSYHLDFFSLVVSAPISFVSYIAASSVWSFLHGNNIIENGKNTFRWIDFICSNCCCCCRRRNWFASIGASTRSKMTGRRMREREKMFANEVNALDEIKSLYQHRSMNATYLVWPVVLRNLITRERIRFIPNTKWKI